MYGQGHYLIQAQLPGALFDYMDTVFANMAAFSESATRDQTETQTLE